MIAAVAAFRQAGSPLPAVGLARRLESRRRRCRRLEVLRCRLSDATGDA